MSVAHASSGWLMGLLASGRLLCAPPTGDQGASADVSPNVASSAPEQPPALRNPDAGVHSEFVGRREQMVHEDIAGAGVTDTGVLAAFSRVPREEFVPAELVEFAYDSFPLPIAGEATYSQPIVIAIMTELAQISSGQRVLEVGTGTGYLSAILSEMGADVFSIEIVEHVAISAARRLVRLGYGSVRTRVGDGYQGWPDQAPFDAIIITAASPHLPPPLLGQLRVGGRLIAPIGTDEQTLVLVVRRAGGFECSAILPVHFTIMRGEAESAEPRFGGTPVGCK